MHKTYLKAPILETLSVESKILNEETLY